MIKGLWQDRSPGSQLLWLLFLILTGMLTFTGIAMVLATLVYPLSVNDLPHILSGGGGEAGHQALLLIQAVSTIGTFALPALLAGHLFFKVPERALGYGQRGYRPFYALAITLALALTAGGAIDLLLRLSQALPLPANWEALFTAQQANMEAQYRIFLHMEGPLDFARTLLIMAVIPALCEELLFRGALQAVLSRWHRHGAVWISATLFALIHGQYYAFLSILLLGAALGYLRWWSGSLWWPTLLHFINNAAIVVQVYFFDVAYDNLDSAAVQSPLWQVLALSVAFLAIMLVAPKLLRGERLSANGSPPY